MTWFSRKRYQSLQSLTIGQTVIEVPHTFLSDVRKALDADTQFDLKPSIDTLNAAVAAWERVSLLPRLDEYPLLATAVRAEYAMALCTRLSTQFITSDLETAVRLLYQVLGTQYQDLHVERPRWMNALSIALRKRFEKQRTIDDLNQSITTAWDALRSATPQSIYWERIQNNLGIGLLARYDLIGQVSDLNNSIAAFHAALAACDPGSRKWALRQVSFAGPLMRRYELRGQVADLEQALAALNSPGSILDPGSLNWCELQSQRAIALLHRFDALGHTLDLDEALAAMTAALDAAPPTYPKRAAVQSNHGLILATRYKVVGQVADLDAAIASYTEALRGEENVYWVRTQANLGGALVHRFALLKQMPDIDKAIDSFEAALERIGSSGPEWATIQNNLGVALSERYKAQQQLEDLNASVDAHRAALAATPPHTIDWAVRQSNLGSTLHTRFQRLQRPADLDEALIAHQQAVSSAQEGTYDWAFYYAQFSSALLSEYERSRHPEDAQALLAACQKAYSYFNSDHWPEHALLASQNLGTVYAMRMEWNRASEILLEGVALINTIYRGQILDHDREGWISRATNIYRRASYTLARAGRLQDAVTVLEQGRARGLGDRLHLDRANLERVRSIDANAYTMYVQAAQHIRELQRRERYERLLPVVGGEPQGGVANNTKVLLELREKMKQAQVDLDTALTRIRRIPGFEAYLVEPTFADIAPAVQPGVPLVYLDLYADAAFALIVSRAPVTELITVEPLWIDQMTGLDLKALVLEREEQGIAGSYLRGIVGEDGSANLNFLEAVLREMLPLLGERLMGSLAERLRAGGFKALVLLPGLYLPLLPLHAAHYRVRGHDVFFHEEFDIRYAPSARVLVMAKQRQGTAANAILAIGNPRRSAPDLPPLHPAYFADWLASEVCQLMGGGVSLVREAATRYAVEHALKSSRPAHLLLGCHGSFQPVEPLNSRMGLADDDLSLAWLLDHIDLSGTALVTLCSCQTGLREFTRVPDEAIGFPAGFLEVGAQAVIAPLWSVEVLPTVLLLRHLYRHISEGTTPSEALRQSIIWLRRMDRPTFKEQVAELRRGLDSVSARRLDRMVAYGYQDAEPFASPRHWAAFAYHGLSLSESRSHAL